MNWSVVAYLDPGSGAIVLQLVLAGILTAGLFFRRLLLKPFSLLRKSRDDLPADGESTAERDDPR